MKTMRKGAPRLSRRPFVPIPFARLVGASLVICVVSCGGSAAPSNASATSAGVHHASVTVDGVKRTYRLYVPQALDPKLAAPLVVLLHGSDSSGDQIAAILAVCQTCSYEHQAEVGKFILAYPDSIESNWRATSGETNADVSFISDLIDRLSTDFRVDSTRIFVVGLSSGAQMAYRLACQLSDRIAAIASVSGQMVIDDCSPTRPVSILEQHAIEDSYVPYQGAANSIQRWVTLDGCAAKPALSVKGITKTSTWSGCRGGTVVRFDSLTVGDHGWFSSDPSLGDVPPGEPDSTPGTWAFFSNSARA